jgi:hypothetical protein
MPPAWRFHTLVFVANTRLGRNSVGTRNQVQYLRDDEWDPTSARGQQQDMQRPGLSWLWPTCQVSTPPTPRTATPNDTWQFVRQVRSGQLLRAVRKAYHRLPHGD